MSDGPVGMDLEDAMTGILNIQFVHELKSDEVGAWFRDRCFSGGPHGKLFADFERRLGWP